MINRLHYRYPFSGAGPSRVILLTLLIGLLLCPAMDVASGQGTYVVTWWTTQDTTYLASGTYELVAANSLWSDDGMTSDGYQLSAAASIMLPEFGSALLEPPSNELYIPILIGE